MRLMKTQRSIALRVCSAYCTVSGASAMVIAGLIPLHLLAEERRRIFHMAGVVSVTQKQIERERTLQQWQEEWQSGPETWTRRLIRNIRTWHNRKWGTVSYHLTQFLSGQGTFGTFTFKIKKKRDESCICCGAAVDDPNHTVFECPQWAEKRQELCTDLGEISASNVIDKMLKCENGWNKVTDFITYVISAKEKVELRAQENAEY